MSQRIPTIRDIAEACGCHNSTVSRALSNSPLVAAAKRDEILAKAKAMGWRPNPMVSVYMTHRRATQSAQYQANIAYIISQNTPSLQDLPHFIRMSVEGARTQAAARGFTLEPILLRDLGYDMLRLNRMLKSRGITGVLIHAGEPDTDHFHKLDWPTFAVSTWGYSVIRDDIHRAAFNWTQGVRLAVAKLRELAYRHMALVIIERFDTLTNYALSSTFYHLQNHHHPGEKFSVLVVPAETRDPLPHIKRWLQRTRPQVVLGTAEVRVAADELGWNIPGDLALASPHYSSEWPDIAGLDQQPQILGANAIDLITAQISRNERGIPVSPKLVLSSGVWVSAASVPDLNTAATA